MTITVHLMDFQPVDAYARTACGLPWVPEPQDSPDVERVLCKDCAARNEFPRQGEGEVLKVQFGKDLSTVIVEHKVTNMGTGWHVNRKHYATNSNTGGFLAFLGRVPWQRVEKVALQFVALLQEEVEEHHRLRDVEAKLSRLVKELQQP